MIDAVRARLAQHDPGHAAEGEQEDVADRPEHRRLEADRAAPHRRDPGEHLDAGGHRDGHGRQHEIHLRSQGQTGGVHVVRPDDEAQDADRGHGVDHAQIAEDRLAAEGRDHMADDAEGRHDQQIHFRVPEEPEDVLIQHRIAAAGGIEEGGAEMAVRQQHGDRARQHRQGQHDQPGGDVDRPGEQRHLMHGHARRAHVQEGGDEVDAAQNRRRP